MTLLEIILLVIGVVFLIGSFFVSEKLSDKDKENLQKLTKEQIESIISGKMADAGSEMEDVLTEKINEAMDELEKKTDKETNEKIMHISEYSDTVLESVNQSHTEVMFMYSMLNEKQSAVVEMTKTLEGLQDSIQAIDSSVAKKMDLVRDRELELEQKLKAMEQTEVKEAEIPESFNEQLARKFAEETGKKIENNNMEILTLHDEGLTEVEIAKKLGRGLGEVKFVLGLYQED